MTFPIGVMVDSLQLPLAQGIKKAGSLGVQGLQLYATKGDMAPENLTKARRAEILRMIKDEGLVVSAVCGDFFGHGFGDAAENPQKIEKSYAVLDLAQDFACNIVTTHIGAVPADIHHPRYAILSEACQKLGEYGDKVGGCFAIETGPETCGNLKAFLDQLSTKSMKVNFDPANLVMCAGDDPVAGVHLLKDYIVHTHAKDGRQLQVIEPAKLYGFFDDGNEIAIDPDDYYLETPLGEGSVDLPGWVDALDKIGYKGFLTIEREVGDNPEADIRMAVSYLKKLF